MCCHNTFSLTYREHKMSSCIMPSQNYVDKIGGEPLYSHLYVYFVLFCDEVLIL